MSAPDPFSPSDPLNADCPGREVFQLVTSRWVLLILWALRDGELRFHLLRDRVEGISERVLSDVLKRLTRHGLLTRRVVPSVPPQVSYALTPPGARLLSVMGGLTGWIAAELPGIEAALRRADDAG